MKEFPASCRLLLIHLFFVGIILSFTVAPGWAQTFRGAILGTVTDTTGAVVPGRYDYRSQCGHRPCPDHGKPG